MFNSIFFAAERAFLEISIPIPKDLFSSLIKLIRIQPDPVPISNKVILLFLNILTSFSTINSVSGLGINIPLSISNFLLQNSFSLRI